MEKMWSFNSSIHFLDGILPSSTCRTFWFHNIGMFFCLNSQINTEGLCPMDWTHNAMLKWIKQVHNMAALLVGKASPGSHWPTTMEKSHCLTILLWYKNITAYQRYMFRKEGSTKLGLCATLLAPSSIDMYRSRNLPALHWSYKHWSGNDCDVTLFHII